MQFSPFGTAAKYVQCTCNTILHHMHQVKLHCRHAFLSADTCMYMHVELLDIVGTLYCTAKVFAGQKYRPTQIC